MIAATLVLTLSADPPVQPPVSVPAPATEAEVRTPDASAFARRIDGLSDVVPQRRPVVRLGGSIAAVTVDAGELGDGIASRPGKGSIEFLARVPNGTEVALGSLRWEGPQLSWSWNRVSASAFRAQLESLGEALPIATFSIDLDGGKRVMLQAPAAKLKATLVPGATGRTRVPVLPGRIPDIAPADSEEWFPASSADSPAASVVRACDAGEIRLSWDAATSELVAEWVSALAVEMAILRDEIDAKRKELAIRTRDERQVIEAEIDGLERRIRELGGSPGVRPPDPPPFPSIELRGPQGRVFAKVDLQLRTKATK